MANELVPTNPDEFLIYQTQDARTRVQVRFERDTVWLTQIQMADLFQTTKQNVSLHIRNLFEERELEESSVIKVYLTTAADGKQYDTRHYNLDVIISVGYRAKSLRGTAFRQSATGDEGDPLEDVMRRLRSELEVQFAESARPTGVIRENLSRFNTGGRPNGT